MQCPLLPLRPPVPQQRLARGGADLYLADEPLCAGGDALPEASPGGLLVAKGLEAITKLSRAVPLAVIVLARGGRREQPGLPNLLQPQGGVTECVGERRPCWRGLQVRRIVPRCRRHLLVGAGGPPQRLDNLGCVAERIRERRSGRGGVLAHQRQLLSRTRLHGLRRGRASVPQRRQTVGLEQVRKRARVLQGVAAFHPLAPQPLDLAGGLIPRIDRRLHGQGGLPAPVEVPGSTPVPPLELDAACCPHALPQPPPALNVSGCCMLS
mmetsp:Transcript_24317/g.77150  ORF Transcript_24317/g.77150 Transcript_24317/m.77150 type:complete len:267 (-) Transcript_24317:331-1131(-)